MKGLTGRTAIVTGGSTLIGQAVVRELHGHGMSVAIADIDDPPGEALVAELGERALFRHTDITQDAEIAALVDDVAPASAASMRSSISPAPTSTGVRLAARGLARGPRRESRQRGRDGAGAAPAPAAERAWRDRQFRLDLRERGADGPLALPGLQGGDRAADAEHGDGPRVRQDPRQRGLARLDVVEGDGRADGRRPRQDRPRGGAVPPARPCRRPGGSRPRGRLPAVRRRELRHRR